MADNGSGVGTGLIAGILLILVLGLGIILFATGNIDLRGGRDVDVNVELPKAPPIPGAILSLTNFTFTRALASARAFFCLTVESRKPC